MRTVILLRRRSGFGHRPLHDWFVLDEVALGQSSVRTLLFSPVSIIPPMLHTHSLHLYESHPVVFITEQNTLRQSNKTGLFWFKLCLYTCATCFGLYLGHNQACQYENPTKEEIIKSKWPFVQSLFIFIYIYTYIYMCVCVCVCVRARARVC
jgi:hypothetical protein